MLEEAQYHLQTAGELIEAVLDDVGDQNAKVYFLDRLKIMVSGDHGYLSNDLSVDDLIERARTEWDTVDKMIDEDDEYDEDDEDDGEKNNV